MTAPSESQLRDLYERSLVQLEGLRHRRANLQRELDNATNSIIALQGTLAALQVAIGEPYDPSTVPMDLAIREIAQCSKTALPSG